MNLPASTTRGFFEILMPGIFLVLNLALTAYLVASAVVPQLLPAIKSAITHCANPAVLISLLVVFGYPVGVVLRLLKNANIDGHSARYIGMLHPGERDLPYLKDKFFYGNWMRDKCRSRLPAEAARFYEEYWADKDTGDSRKNTTFFNFCKTLVAKHDPQSASEIFAAEALCRFVAGSYYALLVSVFLMVMNALCVYAQFSIRAAVLVLVLAACYLYLVHVILSQYRLLRCKEVDTAFNACFANREHFDQLCPTHASRLLKRHSIVPEYDMRRDVLLEAWGERWTGERLVQSLDLQKLISVMKRESSVHSYLSSLYFAGSDVDHPFFLENTKVAVGMAILPQDASKAGVPKRHPYQTEIIIVLKGSLCLHHDINGKRTEKILSENDHFVIANDTCHWVTCIDDSDAVYLFVKTNPSQEPRSESCLLPKAREEQDSVVGVSAKSPFTRVPNAHGKIEPSDPPDKQ